MSKCRPSAGDRIGTLAKYGVTLSDVTQTAKSVDIDRDQEVPERRVIISIPYESLRDEKEVQIAFQDFVYISTTE